MADVDASDDPAARVAYLDLFTRTFDRMIRDLIVAMGLQAGDRVLDVGCGAGDAAFVIAEFVGEAGRVVGLDSSATMITAARERVPPGETRVEFVEHDVYAMPFPDDAFDAARCSRVLVHLADPVRAIREIARVTRPGGRIMVMDPDFGGQMVDTDHRDLYARLREARVRQRATAPGDPWRGRQLWGLCRQAGLVDLRVTGLAVAIASLELANQMEPILGMARDAVGAGAITPEEADLWEREMRQRDAEGRFFASVPGFAVYGTVPDRGAAT
jgi:SAM-dependent methyltransferase